MRDNTQCINDASSSYLLMISCFSTPPFYCRYILCHILSNPLLFLLIPKRHRWFHPQDFLPSQAKFRVTSLTYVRPGQQALSLQLPKIWPMWSFLCPVMLVAENKKKHTWSRMWRIFSISLGLWVCNCASEQTLPRSWSLESLGWQASIISTKHRTSQPNNKDQ